MRKLWKFILNRNNRELISWVVGGLVATIVAVWNIYPILFPSTNGPSNFPKPSRTYDATTSLFVCTGQACQPGDWPINTLNPVGVDGNCYVEHVASNLVAGKTASFFVLSLTPIKGSIEGITVTRISHHPSAFSGEGYEKHLKLCGTTTTNEDRRAKLLIGISY